MSPTTVLCRRRRGATAIEYGLIAMLVSVAIISGVTLFSESLDTLFTSVADTVVEAVGS